MVGGTRGTASKHRTHPFAVAAFESKMRTRSSKLRNDKRDDRALNKEKSIDLCGRGGEEKAKLERSE